MSGELIKISELVGSGVGTMGNLSEIAEMGRWVEQNRHLLETARWVEQKFYLSEAVETAMAGSW